MSEDPVGPAGISTGAKSVTASHVARARSRAGRRLSAQRGTLRPLGLAVIAAVVAGAIAGSPVPGLRGEGLGVTLALCVFAGTLALAIRDGFPARPQGVQAGAIAAMGGAGVALAALQPRDATVLAGGAAVWMAVVRLRPTVGIVLAAAIVVGLDLATALAGSAASTVVGATVLCALLGLVAHFMRQARAREDEAELLLARLEDAREDQLRAAALTERSRIAGELHDVLAHSLSGAAIQLQGARKLAERDSAGPEIRAAIDRAGELVRDGLADAKQAVGALRGEELPGVAQLPSLLRGFEQDTGVRVTLKVEGDARSLPADASLSLYRGAQEALTNVARYAPGADTAVVVRYGAERTSLVVENDAASAAARGLDDVGGGRGLAGLRERVERVGGRMRAGPTETGWRVELDVPG